MNDHEKNFILERTTKHAKKRNYDFSFPRMELDFV